MPYANMSRQMLTITLKDLQTQLQSTPNATNRKLLLNIIMRVLSQISRFRH